MVSPGLVESANGPTNTLTLNNSDGSTKSTFNMSSFERATRLRSSEVTPTTQTTVFKLMQLGNPSQGRSSRGPLQVRNEMFTPLASPGEAPETVNSKP